jgi:hypothetical protein
MEQEMSCYQIGSNSWNYKNPSAQMPNLKFQGETEGANFEKG